MDNRQEYIRLAVEYAKASEARVQAHEDMEMHWARLTAAEKRGLRHQAREAMAEVFLRLDPASPR